jgi:Putative abortive phage resistance protein AbiGi, antitoxin
MALMPGQRYVSHELTHFVGRSLRGQIATPEEVQDQQFAVLVKILRDGALGQQIGGARRVIAFQTGEAKLSSSEKYSAQMVCFCDIPVDDLSLHMRKYSQFGLAFSKQFLIGAGATPVFYISEGSVVPSSSFVSSTPFDTALRFPSKRRSTRMSAIGRGCSRTSTWCCLAPSTWLWGFGLSFCR